MMYRTLRELKFEPEGPEVPGAIKSFRLELRTTRQSRRTPRENWQQDTSVPMPAHVRTPLAEGLSRRELSELIAEAADWLAYIEEAPL
jgi:hypothetical protein